MTGDVTHPASLDPPPRALMSSYQPCRVAPGHLDGQVALAESAVRNGVPRFIPSDFAIDLFNAPAGAPQLDMRRETDDIIHALPRRHRAVHLEDPNRSRRSGRYPFISGAETAFNAIIGEQTALR